MYGRIAFYVGNGNIEINGKTFGLGEITTEFLNIDKTVYTKMRDQLEVAENKIDEYVKTKDMADWFYANEKYIKLDGMIRKYPLLNLFREDTEILEEARILTSQPTLFEDDSYELTSKDEEILRKITAYDDYLQNPGEYGGIETYSLQNCQSGEIHTFNKSQPPIPEEPPAKSRNLLIFPGSLETKWKFYKDFCDTYTLFLYDIESFTYTIHNFIYFFLSSLDKLNSSNYAMALYSMFNHPRKDKLVANPFRGTGLFTSSDLAKITYIPKETSEGSDEYRIFQLYEVETLQTLLKTDFYNALEMGYIIRKCEYCGRYFLLKKAYHTKYCDQPAPDNPKYTCAQLGYHRMGIKELTPDNPKAQSLKRCYQRIDKDCSRYIISVEDRDKLYAKAKELYFEATTGSGVSNDDFEAQLASKNLYALCGVVRKTKPRGRPKST